jgi:hypothetical protein
MKFSPSKAAIESEAFAQGFKELKRECGSYLRKELSRE